MRSESFSELKGGAKKEIAKIEKISRGYSLIELLLVIAFIAGALVLAFVTYPKVQATSRANVESQHLIAISTGLRSLYATARSFEGVGNRVMIDAKLVPDDMRVVGDVIYNVWDGTVSTVVANHVERYMLTYTNVPAAECVKIATGAGVNFLALTIGDYTIFDRAYGVGYDDTGGGVTIKPELAAQACQANPNGNTMVFYAK